MNLTGWVLIVAIVLATVVYGAGFISTQLYDTVLGVIGAGGIIGLRNMIQSSGYKTYIVAIGGAIVTLLYGFGVISQEVFSTLAVAVLGLAAATLSHALSKQ